MRPKLGMTEATSYNLARLNLLQQRRGGRGCLSLNRTNGEAKKESGLLDLRANDGLGWPQHFR